MQKIQRRFVFSLGAPLLVVSAALLASGSPTTFACGLALSQLCVACIEITSNLHVLEHIPRHALRHFEPARIFACAGPWTFGPWFGVYLQQRVTFAAPFAVAAVAAIVLLALF